MDYTKFYIAIRRYAKGKIIRGEFYVEWVDAQRQNGIEISKPIWLKNPAYLKAGKVSA